MAKWPVLNEWEDVFLTGLQDNSGGVAKVSFP